MGGVQHGAAGSLIHAAGFHAHQTVLDQINAAHAVAGSNLVGLGQQFDGFHLLAVDGNGHALLKVDGDVLGLVGGIFGGDHGQQQVGRGLVPGILQVSAFMADVPDVAVHGVGAILLHGHRDAAGLGVFDLLLAGLDIPDTPGGDDLHVGVEGLDGQLEANLVIALAGAAVADSRAVFSMGDLHQALGDQGTGKGGTQQVLALVHRAGLQGRPDEVLHKFLAQVGDVQLLRAALGSLLVQGLQLLALAHIARYADHVAVVVFLQPRDDNGRIQTTGVRQQNTHLCHINQSPLRILIGLTNGIIQPDE